MSLDSQVQYHFTKRRIQCQVAFHNRCGPTSLLNASITEDFNEYDLTKIKPALRSPASKYLQLQDLVARRGCEGTEAPRVRDHLEVRGHMGYQDMMELQGQSDKLV